MARNSSTEGDDGPPIEFFVEAHQQQQKQTCLLGRFVTHVTWLLLIVLLTALVASTLVCASTIIRCDRPTAVHNTTASVSNTAAAATTSIVCPQLNCRTLFCPFSNSSISTASPVPVHRCPQCPTSHCRIGGCIATQTVAYHLRLYCARNAGQYIIWSDNRHAELKLNLLQTFPDDQQHEHGVTAQLQSAERS